MASKLGRVALLTAYLATVAWGQEAVERMERRWQTEGRENHVFPAYDSKREKGQAKGSFEPTELQVDNGTALRRCCRRPSTTRGRRSSVCYPSPKALSEREELWKTYEADLRQAYRREYNRFHKDMERLRDDLQKAIAAQAGARAELLRVFHHGPRQEAETEEADRAYDQMMEGWMAETDGLDARSVLQRALGAAPPAAAGRDPGMRPLQMEVDNGWMQPAGSARADRIGRYSAGSFRPFGRADCCCAIEGCSGSCQCGARWICQCGGQGSVYGEPECSPGQHYKAPDGTRVSVKTRPHTGPPPTGGQSLGAKLDARRHALAPFGLASVVPRSAEATALTATQELGGATEAPFLSDQEIQARLHTFAEPPAAGVIDDDHEDEPT